jgi:hypothetical protein
MKKISVIFLLVLAGAALILYEVSVAQTTPKGDLILTSKKVKSAPSDANSSQWNQSKESKFVLVGAGNIEGKVIELKAKSVYTKDKIFFRMEWPDKDKSMDKNAWKYTGGKWVKQKANEDRLGVLWEINRIDKFATKGCAILCHNESKNNEEWYYAVNSPKEKADLWHWKSVRSNPVGFTEDGFVIDNPTKKPEEGRKRDGGNKPYKAGNNRTKDKKGPAFTQNPAQNASFPGSLLKSEAIELTSAHTPKEGDWLPGYVLNANWKESFGDVKTEGVWKDGKWTLMLSRMLDTGNDDDVRYNTRKKYSFAIGVFDNSGAEHSYNSEALKLQFK